jgi:hypothetical protein
VKIAHLFAAAKFSLTRLTRALRKLGLVLLFAGGAAVIALAVVFPLWFFATRHTRAYTIFAWLMVLSVFLSSVGRSLVRSARLHGGLLPAARDKLLPALTNFLFFLFFICALYGIIFLYASRQLAAAIAATCGYLILVVIVTYFRRRNT